MSRSKYGKPRAKFGEIKIKWGYSAREGEDFFMCYGGHIGGRRDSRLLFYTLTDRPFDRMTEKYRPSLMDELERRGYDTKTLVISVQKKPELLEGESHD